MDLNDGMKGIIEKLDEIKDGLDKENNTDTLKKTLKIQNDFFKECSKYFRNQSKNQEIFLELFKTQNEILKKIGEKNVDREKISTGQHRKR